MLPRSSPTRQLISERGTQPTLLPLHHNLTPPERTTRQRHLLAPRLRVPALEPRERLQQANRRVRGLGQREVLPDADPRPAVERQVVPPRAKLQLLVDPALGFEFECVGAVDLLAPVHREQVPAHDAALGHEGRGFPVRPAAEGEDCVFEGGASVHGDDGVEA